MQVLKFSPSSSSSLADNRKTLEGDLSHLLTSIPLPLPVLSFLLRRDEVGLASLNVGLHSALSPYHARCLLIRVCGRPRDRHGPRARTADAGAGAGGVSEDGIRKTEVRPLLPS